VAKEIENAGETGQLGAGAVLSGGGAALNGVVDLAQHVFGVPVRVGIPGTGMIGLTDAVNHPQYATATGLMLLGAEQVAHSTLGIGFGDGVAGRVMAWLREFF
jgi:cell division protein FtsA